MQQANNTSGFLALNDVNVNSPVPITSNGDQSLVKDYMQTQYDSPMLTFDNRPSPTMSPGLSKFEKQIRTSVDFVDKEQLIKVSDDKAREARALANNIQQAELNS